jgi:tRNA(Ile)-lysidine synthase
MKAVNNQYLKPLLNVRKVDLQRYMEENGYSWREDASNKEVVYTRNKVRLNLVPLLQDIAGGTEALYR